MIGMKQWLQAWIRSLIVATKGMDIVTTVGQCPVSEKVLRKPIAAKRLESQEVLATQPVDSVSENPEVLPSEGLKEHKAAEDETMVAIQLSPMVQSEQVLPQAPCEENRIEKALDPEEEKVLCSKNNTLPQQTVDQHSVPACTVTMKVYINFKLKRYMSGEPLVQSGLLERALTLEGAHRYIRHHMQQACLF